MTINPWTFECFLMPPKYCITLINVTDILVMLCDKMQFLSLLEKFMSLFCQNLNWNLLFKCFKGFVTWGSLLISLLKLLYLIFMFWLNLPEGVDGPSRVQLLQLSSQGRDKLQLLIPLVLQTHNSMPPAIHLQLDTRRVLLLPYTVQYVQILVCTLPSTFS